MGPPAAASAGRRRHRGEPRPPSPRAGGVCPRDGSAGLSAPLPDRSRRPRRVRRGAAVGRGDGRAQGRAPRVRSDERVGRGSAPRLRPPSDRGPAGRGRRCRHPRRRPAGVRAVRRGARRGPDAGGRLPGADGLPGSAGPACRGAARSTSAAAGSCARSSVPIPPTRRAPCTSRSSPGAHRPAPAARGGHPQSVPFLGRRVELARLSSPTDECAVRVVLGEPGVGKSRLLDEALAALDRQEVRSTKCFRLVSPVPYAVLTDLAPELLSGDEPSASTAETNVAHLAAAWADEVSARPTVLVIDDLQWADEPSLAALGLVLRRRPRGLLVLAAAREAELDPDGAARQFLELATGLGLADTVPLAALTPEEVVAGGFSFAAWKRTGGHPLLFTECLRGGGEDDLAALVLARATEAGADAVELLRSAAVLDRAAPLADLARLAELSPAAGRAAAERLVRQGLVVETGGLWRVRHDVFAELVQAALAPAARRAWHARALEELQEHGADPAELAHHALAAEVWDAAVRFSLAAGDRSLAAYANREAVGHYGQGARAPHGAEAGRRRARSCAASGGARRGACAHRARPNRGSPPSAGPAPEHHRAGRGRAAARRSRLRLGRVEAHAGDRTGRAGVADRPRARRRRARGSPPRVHRQPVRQPRRSRAGQRPHRCCVRDRRRGAASHRPRSSSTVSA